MNQNCRSCKLNQNPFRIYGYQTRGWRDTTYKFCVNSYGFSFINAQGTQQTEEGAGQVAQAGRKNHREFW